MKKFLSTAVALGMIAGLAATASALELTVTGKYVADGYYINSGLGAAGGLGVAPWSGDNYTSDAWYQHTFRIDPTLKINDKVTVKGDIRLINSNSVWGTQDDLDYGDGGGVNIKKLWLLYESPVGKWEVGRRPAGAWMHDFVNSGTSADRIMWWMPKMDNFKAYAFLQKSTEVDGYDSYTTVTDPVTGDETTTYTGLDDNDNDYYEVAGAYVADGVTTWLGLGTAQDNGAANVNMWRVKGYAKVDINKEFGVVTEFDWKTGDKGLNGATDINSQALMVAGTMNMGEISSMLGYAYISGDNTADNEDTAYDRSHGMGDDFEPLYILTGSVANVLNGDRGASDVGTAVRTAGAHAIVALADFKASEDLTLHGGLGWGMADDAAAGFDDDYGFEFDLGLAYNLYQNLTYELHFGWWLVGDFATLAGTRSTEDVYLLSHHLSMKF
jgi:hypothetical protein